MMTLQDDLVMETINIETVYEGSQICPRCGNLLTPLEVLYTSLGLCPDCRNAKYEEHAKRGMNGQ